MLKNFNFNHTLIGICIGLIAPIIGFFFFKWSFFNYFDNTGFFNHLLSNNLLSSVISISLICNAAVFFFTINRNWLYAGRGIILATFIYGVLIVYLKFFYNTTAV
jgi:hypothetical protein